LVLVVELAGGVVGPDDQAGDDVARVLLTLAMFRQALAESEGVGRRPSPRGQLPTGLPSWAPLLADGPWSAQHQPVGRQHQRPSANRPPAPMPSARAGGRPPLGRGPAPGLPPVNRHASGCSNPGVIGPLRLAQRPAHQLVTGPGASAANARNFGLLDALWSTIDCSVPHGVSAPTAAGSVERLFHRRSGRAAPTKRQASTDAVGHPPRSCTAYCRWLNASPAGCRWTRAAKMRFRPVDGPALRVRPPRSNSPPSRARRATRPALDGVQGLPA